MQEQALNMTCFNQSTNFSDHLFYEDVFRFERIVAFVVPTIFSLIAIIGFVGNVLVIVVVVSNKQMRNTTNILILNLAIADLLFIVVCIPFTAVVYSLTVWPFGGITCKCYQYVIHVTTYVSVFTLVLMSLDRYLAVVHAIKSMTYRTERNAFLATGILWLLMLSLNVPVLVEFEAVTYAFAGETRSGCFNPRFPIAEWRARLFYATFFAFGFALPLTTICVLYGFMLHRLLYGGLPRGYQSAESLRTKKRVARMVIIIVLIFALCWLPLQVMFMIQFFGPSELTSTTQFVSIRIASTCFAYMNSCVNPLLYGFLSENFRKSFQRLLCHGQRFEPVKTHVSRSPGGRLLDQMTPMTVLTESKPDLLNGNS